MSDARGFPPAEFAARAAAAQARMGAAGLDALLLTTEPEVRYYTGFLTRFWESPTRPWFVILPAWGKPVAVIPAIGAALMGRTWVEDIRTWAAPDYRDDGIGLLSETLRDLGARRIGLADGIETHARLPRADLDRLRGLHDIVGDGDITRTLRAVKSPAEIARIEAAVAIAGRAFARVGEIARPGVPLSRVFRDFQRLALEEGADHVPYLAGGAGPGGYADVISPATETPLAAGDVLMLDTGLSRDGYFCDYDRNWSLGPPSAATARAHDRLLEATARGFEAARPGATMADLHAAMAPLLTGPDGAPVAGRLGHGLGMQLTEGASVLPFDHTELVPGMVLTLEPSVMVDADRLLVHEENIAITQTGARWLSAPATGLAVLE